MIDDGSLDYVSVLDEHDPNYDPEEDRSRNYGSTRVSRDHHPYFHTSSFYAFTCVLNCLE